MNKDKWDQTWRLNEATVRKLSRRKQEPAWMLESRLAALAEFERAENPAWLPDLAGLKIEKIGMYVRPAVKTVESWAEVPREIRETFERLGIPRSERAGLAGVGAQYDSEIIYRHIQDDVRALGVIYADLTSVIRGEYDDSGRSWSALAREKFGKLISATAHRFAALNLAVWSGGSLVYVPENIEVEIPLQAYYRLNAPGAGQFEHTLIIAEKNAKLTFIEGCSAPKYNIANLHAGAVEIFVGEGARVRFLTVENWSKNLYNLSTKRARVEKNGRMEWVAGTFGSKVSCIYPTSILAGEGASVEFYGISLAGAGQILDTGAKVIHLAPNTASQIETKSLAHDGGVANFRGLVKVGEKAVGAKSTTTCDSLLLDDRSKSESWPVQEVENTKSDIGHEARIGKISEAVVAYLMTRGLSAEEARGVIVGGFAESVVRELPLEYAVEMANLIRLETGEGGGEIERKTGGAAA